MRNSIAARKPFIRSWLTRASLVCLSLGLCNTAFAQLEITEVMFNPLDENVWEWIEVRNTGGSAVDLNGYIGFNLGDAEIVAPNPTVLTGQSQNTMIGPGEVAVIYDANYGSGNAPMANPNNFVDANFRSAYGLAPSVPLIGANFWPEIFNTVGSQVQSVGFWANATDYAMDITPVEDDPVNNPGVFTNRVTKFDNTAFSLNFSGASFPAVDGMSSIAWTGNGSNTDGTKWVKSVSGTNGAVTSTEVKVPGFINSDADQGNPGIFPPGTPGTMGLHITEIMYNPASNPDNSWEWVELYNSTASAIDLTGYILDDANANQAASDAAGNIASGSIASGGTAILFNSVLDLADFKAAWGATINAIPVTGWGNMSLNNSGDAIGLWSSFADYDGNQSFDLTLGTGHANAVVNQVYDTTNFPVASPAGPSLSLADLSLDPADGGNWDNGITGDSIGSFNANLVAGAGGLITLHAGGDVGSPGSFSVVAANPGDFDGDGDADGNDFLVWQRGNSPTGPLSPVDLAAWQGAFGTPLTAAVGAVPEPATLALLGLVLLPLACGRKRSV